jgi:hypothetical protein
VSRHLPTILLILSLPVGLVAYNAAVGVLQALPLSDQARQLLLVLAPLFFAGLVMVPFIVPFFDRMAKRDLAAHRERQAAEASLDTDPAGEPGPGDSPAP